MIAMSEQASPNRNHSLGAKRRGASPSNYNSIDSHNLNGLNATANNRKILQLEDKIAQMEDKFNSVQFKA